MMSHCSRVATRRLMWSLVGTRTLPLSQWIACISSRIGASPEDRMVSRLMPALLRSMQLVFKVDASSPLDDRREHREREGRLSARH